MLTSLRAFSATTGIPRREASSKANAVAAADTGDSSDADEDGHVIADLSMCRFGITNDRQGAMSAVDEPRVD